MGSARFRSHTSCLVGLLVAGAIPLGACGDRSPAQPSTPPAPTITAARVGISGLSFFAFTHLRPGESARLTATAQLTDSTLFDCTRIAKWTTEDTRIVRFPQPGEALATGPGIVTIRASCGGATGQFSISVRYNGRGVVRQATGQPVPNATVFYPVGSGSATTDANGAFEMLDLLLREFDVMVSGVGYETTSDRIVWKGGAETTGIELIARPLGGIRILEASGKISLGRSSTAGRGCTKSSGQACWKPSTRRA